MKKEESLLYWYLRANGRAAECETPMTKVYLVATGELSEKGFPLYELHDQRVPMCDQEVLYRRPVSI